MKMYADYLKICGVPTKVISFGKRIVLENVEETEPNDVILLIPGNPGSPDFYTKFMQTLHDQTKCTVVAVGHTGHNFTKSENFPSLKSNGQLYGLRGQILHKISFIENYISKTARIHIIGHSIGAYIAVQLLKESSIRCRVSNVHLLFPTIEEMAASPNGVLYTRTSLFACLLVFCCWILNLFPHFLKNLMFGVYKLLFFNSSRLQVNDEVFLDMLHPEVIKKIFFMANEEMKAVKKRDSSILMENKHLIKLYYGASDNWTPRSYFDNLKSEIPDIDAQVCDKGYDHAFVLYNSVEVGNLVANWIKKIN